MTTLDDYRRTAQERPNTVVLADTADHSGLAVIGQNLGFLNAFRELKLEQEADLPLWWLTINGVAYAYEDEAIANEDLDAILSAAFPVYLRGIGDDDQLDALLKRLSAEAAQRRAASTVEAGA